MDLRFKILFLGESEVGKTCLLLKYTDGIFESNLLPTIGIDVKYKYIEKGNKKIRLDLWDTAGQERFGTISKNYFKDSNGIILVYDITKESTFHKLKNWMDNINDNADNNIEKIIVGNKCDLKERQIDKKNLEIFANKYNIPYFEASAKTGENLENIFNTLINNLLSKKDIGVNVSDDEEDESKKNIFTINKQNENDDKNNNCIC